MVVTSGVIDFVDGVNHVDDVLHRHGFVRTQHHRGLTVIADFAVDEVGELGLIGDSFVNVILKLVVDVNRDGLFGHGLAVARWQHELDGIGGN